MKIATAIVAVLALFGAPAMGSPASVSPANPFQERPQPSRNVAILIFDGVQIIDYTGPWETLGHVYSAAQPVPFNIYTVAAKTDAITTAMGMSVNPKYTFANAPQPDIIIVPGGGVEAATGNPRAMKWLVDSSKNAGIVMSVCNGAFILAKAGMLDGLKATTTAFLIEPFKLAAPKTKVVSDQRFVDNGKIITTAGLSAGIDGTLHIVERLYGRGTAQMAALGMEYNWDPDSKYVRAAFADKYMPSRYDIETVTKSWVTVERDGDVDHWVNKWAAITDATPADVLGHIEESFVKSDYFSREPNMKWTKQNEDTSAGRARSLWKFSDEQGRPWSGAAEVEPVAGEKKSYVVTVRVSRIPAA